MTSAGGAAGGQVFVVDIVGRGRSELWPGTEEQKEAKKISPQKFGGGGSGNVVGRGDGDDPERRFSLVEAPEDIGQIFGAESPSSKIRSKNVFFPDGGGDLVEPPPPPLDKYTVRVLIERRRIRFFDGSGRFLREISSDASTSSPNDTTTISPNADSDHVIVDSDVIVPPPASPGEPIPAPARRSRSSEEDSRIYHPASSEEDSRTYHPASSEEDSRTYHPASSEEDSIDATMASWAYHPVGRMQHPMWYGAHALYARCKGFGGPQLRRSSTPPPSNTAIDPSFAPFHFRSSFAVAFHGHMPFDALEKRKLNFFFTKTKEEKFGFPLELVHRMVRERLHCPGVICRGYTARVWKEGGEDEDAGDTSAENPATPGVVGFSADVSEVVVPSAGSGGGRGSMQDEERAFFAGDDLDEDQRSSSERIDDHDVRPSSRSPARPVDKNGVDDEMNHARSEQSRVHSLIDEYFPADFAARKSKSGFRFFLQEFIKCWKNGVVSSKEKGVRPVLDAFHSRLADAFYPDTTTFSRFLYAVTK